MLEDHKANDMTHPPILDWSETTRWYDENAKAFAEGANALDTSDYTETFLKGLPQGARILDAGCGTGRDARQFLAQGYKVGAFDPSAAMCAATQEATRGAVIPRVMGFADYADPAGSWDGIWAMASLLHLPRAEIAPTVARLLTSLAPGGRLFICLKHGSGERVDERGRPMSFMTEGEMQEMLIATAPQDARIEIWRKDSIASDGHAQAWTNAIVHLRHS